MKRLFVFLLPLLIALPSLAFAEEAPSDPNTLATSALATANLHNYLGTDDVRVFAGTIIKTILGLSGAAALVMVIWGGLIWMTSGGNPDKVKKGLNTLLWAGIGLASLFAAYAVVNWVIGAIQQSTG